MLKRVSILVCFAVLGIVVSVFGKELKTDHLLVAMGPSPVEKLYPKLKDAFKKETGIEIELVNSAGMSGNNAVRLVDLEKADLAISGGDWEAILAQIEKSSKLVNKEKLQNKVIGIEPTYFLTWPEGPKVLSEADIYKIFTNKVSNWKELGGADLKIQIGLPLNFLSTIDLLSLRYLKGEQVAGVVKNFDAKDMRMFLEKTPGAVALAVPSSLGGSVHRPKSPPLDRNMNFITLGPPAGNTLKLLQKVLAVAPEVYPTAP
jgi:phosphate transport system substrate-binding protein